MALSVFGVGVDVHAGGRDLRFPHHAYHAAMAESFTGVRPYARAWLHAGTVTTGGVKMAKSAGNLVLVSDLLAAYPAAAIRLMILDRSWSETGITGLTCSTPLQAGWKACTARPAAPSRPALVTEPGSGACWPLT